MPARLGLLVLLVLLCIASVGTPASLADAASPQWEPSAADVTRTVRPCPAGVGAPADTVCWSVTEDTSAWMAMPAGSPYPWGQCTYYAGLMRPDLFNDRAPSSVDLLASWDAWTWVAHAQAEGLPVDGDPRPGDVMVYSRKAAGNDTGHVAIVDAVGGADPATGDQTVTVSEMNVEGLDDASRGQGDTMTLDLPRSELVPGMIQFIHRSTAQWGTERNPSLAVGLWGGQLAMVSQSAAPATAVVTASDGSVVKRLSVRPNRVVALGLPTGTYRACVGQAATAAWDSAANCAAASWQAPVAATVSLGRPRRSGRRLAVPVVLGPRLPPALAAKRTGVIAEVRIEVQSAAGTAVAASVRAVYTRVWHLRAGQQVLRLRLMAAPGR
ncbi:MAG TPA: CHAP domain-containing protein, partial [Solirubrobacteraceae bacterium]|nr:CHAP domain-containing protein [Solirubrobacteraceae bacterium]